MTRDRQRWQAGFSSITRRSSVIPPVELRVPAPLALPRCSGISCLPVRGEA